MCLINFQFQDHPNYKLIIAANRDEFYERPTAPAHFWEDEPEILAGRDLLQMGTWLGITKQGRFAALTNFRDPTQLTAGKITRGEIIKNYLAGNRSPQDFLYSLNENRDQYEGFNIILGDADQLFYYNNIQAEIMGIPKGTHSLSNRYLNTPWPKVVKGKKSLAECIMKQEKIEPNELFNILTDTEEAEDMHLPETGIGLNLERQLSPLFIKTPNYGTRSSTILVVDKDNYVTFAERTYENGIFTEENNFTFQI